MESTGKRFASKCWRQRRRIGVLVIGTTAALLLQMNGSWVWPALLPLAGLAILALADDMRGIIEAASVAVVPTVVLPTGFQAPIFVALTVGLYWLLHIHGPRTGARRFTLRGTWSSTHQQPRDLVWRALVPGEGRPALHWSGSFAATVADPADPDTLYIHYEDPDDALRFETVTRIELRRPKFAHFAVENHDARAGQQAFVRLKLTQTEGKTTRARCDVELTHQRLAEVALLWLDDDFGPGLEGLDPDRDLSDLPTQALSRPRPQITQVVQEMQRHPETSVHSGS